MESDGVETLASGGAEGVSKWGELAGLSFVSLVMGLTSLGAGLCTQACRVSQDRMKTLNAFGVGMLLSTALSVIIPEGVHALYMAKGHHDHHGEAEESGGGVGTNAIIGFSLLLGFFGMLTVDNVKAFGGMHGHSHNYHQVHHGSGEKKTDGDVEEDDSHTRHHRQDIRIGKAKQKRAAITLGLLVHSAVDGFALGAAHAAENAESLQFIVFIAIVMHKIPAAFGLSTLLRTSGSSDAAVRRSVAMFAGAAPVGAMSAFFLLHRGFVGLGTLSPQALGFTLLLSGGTFLYVSAVHALKELSSSSSNQSDRIPPRHLVCVFAGAVGPFVLSLFHAH